MSIRLSWNDINYGEEEHRVYRSTSPIDTQNPPAPLVTLGPNINTYDDTTAVSGTTYYYRVAALNQGALYFSDEVSILASDAFSPSSLFLGSEQGMYYDFSDLTTLFQDTAGTIPVTADGDSVALVLDKSPNGIDLVQSTASLRPIYRTDGTLHWLESLGSDWISAPSLITLGSSYGLSYGGRFYSYQDFFGPFRFLRDGGGATSTIDNRLEEYTRTANNSRALISRYQAAGTNSDRTGVFPSENTNLVAWANRNVGVEEALGEYWPSSPYGLVASSLPYSSGTARLSLFRGYRGDIANMRIYSFFYINRGLSTTERNDLNTWSGQRAGVTIS